MGIESTFKVCFAKTALPPAYNWLSLVLIHGQVNLHYILVLMYLILINVIRFGVQTAVI